MGLPQFAVTSLLRFRQPKKTRAQEKMAPGQKLGGSSTCQCGHDDDGEEADETNQCHPLSLPFKLPYRRQFVLPKFVGRARNRFFTCGACVDCDHVFLARLSCVLFANRDGEIYALYHEIWDELRLAGHQARESAAALPRYTHFAAIVVEAFATTFELGNAFLCEDDLVGPTGCVVAAWHGSSPYDG